MPNRFAIYIVCCAPCAFAEECESDRLYKYIYMAPRHAVKICEREAQVGKWRRTWQLGAAANRLWMVV